MTAVQGGEAMLDVRPSRAEIEPMALSLIERRGAEVLSTARRHAYNEHDAEDAYQRGLEILLTKAPSVDEDVIVPWLKVVVKHEAFAIARERGRDLPHLPAIFDDLPGEADGADNAERVERVRVGREALARLKPQETRCLVLLAQGYTYDQIQAATGFSYTKVNRCLAEGRKAFFDRVRGIESGAECRRWAPVLSRLADGEASAEDMDALRPHIKGCAACRATLREYVDAPRQLTLLLGPLGFAAALTGGAAKAGGTWLSFAALQKAAAGVAATAVIAGGGAVAVHEMDASPPPAKAAVAAKPRPRSAPPKHATTTIASTTSPASTTHHGKKPKHKEPAEQPAPTPAAAVTPTPPVTAPPPPRLSKHSPPPKPPADPGGEFGP